MTNEEHDRLLIERIKEEDHFAFRQLIEKYKDDALTLATSILKNQAVAEDVLQEVFIKVYEKIKSFKYQSTFYTWLYRIVVNRSYNELRKTKNKSFTQPQEETLTAIESTDEVDSNDLNRIITQALNLMKPDEALVLRLFYLSELKIDEVQEITRFSKSKVKVTLHRARKSLAVILKKQLGKEIEDL
ncbi:RNA polymerase sigma factor [Roseivirga misakiensis]|uniref:RNA polymerase sigma factor n=1 Tax=Roseivirga misakiensis TaxID=1563681 RepID=A0A1E5SZP8_9BACT|nr:RNA polymerase sigma factor [Roseivirga misakiensis]OEK04603.1 hypothetical protein BFP71_14175 [Roseivirga misakiensis]